MQTLREVGGGGEGGGGVVCTPYNDLYAGKLRLKRIQFS